MITNPRFHTDRDNIGVLDRPWASTTVPRKAPVEASWPALFPLSKKRRANDTQKSWKKQYLEILQVILAVIDGDA